ncbi:MAG TPA: hypothetical protein DCE41_34620 [Cytophagales bacterium]|nr:hypothetical protein [Cytophagales bacterium]HAA22950.1 hypothetical protein [Cytophagales bacterium]HAP60179.1 hypothetical protein [Cytophagales bacterium]
MNISQQSRLAVLALVSALAACQPTVETPVATQVVEIPVEIDVAGVLRSVKSGEDAMYFVHMRSARGEDVTGEDLITHVTHVAPGDQLVWSVSDPSVAITGFTYEVIEGSDPLASTPGPSGDGNWEADISTNAVSGDAFKYTVFFSIDGGGEYSWDPIVKVDKKDGEVGADGSGN